MALGQVPFQFSNSVLPFSVDCTLVLVRSNLGQASLVFHWPFSFSRRNSLHLVGKGKGNWFIETEVPVPGP